MNYLQVRQAGDIGEDAFLAMLDSELDPVVSVMEAHEVDPEVMEEREADTRWSALHRKHMRARRTFPLGWLRPGSPGF